MKKLKLAHYIGIPLMAVTLFFGIAFEISWLQWVGVALNVGLGVSLLLYLFYGIIKNTKKE